MSRLLSKRLVSATAPGMIEQLSADCEGESQMQSGGTCKCKQTDILTSSGVHSLCRAGLQRCSRQHLLECQRNVAAFMGTSRLSR